MVTEFWLPTEIDGYEVSSSGKVRSKDRLVPRSDTGTLVFQKGLEIIQTTDNCGYLRVRLSVLNSKSTHKVHRLVAIAFIPNPDKLPQVNHKDGHKQNNVVENLEWVNNSENQKHSYQTGLTIAKRSVKSPRFTGPVHVFDKQGNFLYTVNGNAEMQAKGLDYRLVSACLMGKRKSHKGCTFKKEKVIHEN